MKKLGVTNLLNIYSSFSKETPEAIAENYVGKGYGDLKSDLADLVIAQLSPVQDRYNELMKDKGYLESVLKEGGENAQKLAFKTLRKVYKNGFLESFLGLKLFFMNKKRLLSFESYLFNYTLNNGFFEQFRRFRSTR